MDLKARTNKILALAALLAAGPAGASAVIDVTGTPGSGETTWSFSGSATVGGGAITIDDEDDGISWGWVVGTDFYSGIDTSIDFLSSSATLTSGGTTYEILGVGAEVNSPSELFGIAINNPLAPLSSYLFSVGSVLSFAGSATAPMDISELQHGTTAFTDWNEQAATQDGTLPGTFNVGQAPVAPTLALTLLGLSGIAGLRSRDERPRVDRG